MKRALTTAFSLLMLCSLLLSVAGIAKAGNPAYELTEYPSAAVCTVDGEWTSPDEWTDTPPTDMTGNATGRFGYNIQDFTNFGLEWIIEIFTDDTDDAGDYWQICTDNEESNTAAPDSGDFMVEITGHTTLKLYHGTGSGWNEITPDAGEITWENTIAASPWNSTPHWILEITDSSKTSGAWQVATQPPTGMRIAAFDANNDTLAAWAPDSSADVPYEWGRVPTNATEPIPEGFSIAVVVLLSSIAVVIGVNFTRKRPKSEITYKL
jgi:hypothetical protein